MAVRGPEISASITSIRAMIQQSTVSPRIRLKSLLIEVYIAREKAQWESWQDQARSKRPQATEAMLRKGKERKGKVRNDYTQNTPRSTLDRSIPGSPGA